jgi:ribose-phosphate pyrophosphokinase
MQEINNRNMIIPMIRATHLAKGMRIRKSSSWKIVYPLGNKEGQRFFPDGEVYVKIPEEALMTTGRVVILHSGAPDPNGGLIELLMILNIFRKAGKEVEVFFAYFPYGRQDHEFHVGETNAARDILELLTKYYGVKQVYVLDAHFGGQDWVKEYPVTLITALSLLKVAIGRDLKNAKYLGPDAGSQRRANIEGVTKKRKNSFKTVLSADAHFAQTVLNENVVAVDDLVSTGGTMVNFADLCRKKRAKSVSAAISHGALVDGIKRLIAAFDNVYLTNSIDRDDANVDVSPLIFLTISAGPSWTKSAHRV